MQEISPSLARTILDNASKGLWIVTGSSGVGKTSWCVKAVELVRQAGLFAGGILCIAEFDDGRKVGIDLRNIGTGEQRKLGTRQSSTDNGIRVGGWCLDEKVIDWGNKILRALSNRDVVFIDELGPLEFELGGGFHAGLSLLSESRYRTAFIVVRPKLIDNARSRWPHARVIEIGEKLV